LKRILTLALVCLLIFPVDSIAQTQRRRRGAGTQRRRPTATRSTNENARQSAEALSAARARVIEQIKLLTRFLYVFGRISNSIEVSEADARRTGTQTDDLTNRARSSLRENLANVRAGLIQLETDTRSNPALAGFYTRIAGVSDLVARAETSTTAGRFDQAGRAMVEVVSRLTDALRE
jgi:hypothetical protein